MFDGRSGSLNSVRRGVWESQLCSAGGLGVVNLFNGRSGSRKSVRRRTELQSFIKSFIIKGLGGSGSHNYV